jgi:hypothetical protein
LVLLSLTWLRLRLQGLRGLALLIPRGLALGFCRLLPLQILFTSALTQLPRVARLGLNILLPRALTGRVLTFGLSSLGMLTLATGLGM